MVLTKSVVLYDSLLDLARRDAYKYTRYCRVVETGVSQSVGRKR